MMTAGEIKEKLGPRYVSKILKGSRTISRDEIYNVFYGRCKNPVKISKVQKLSAKAIKKQEEAEAFQN